MYNFQQGSHGPERDAERETVAYQKLLAKYEALRAAADEGVFQVTIHSDSGTITMPVSFLEGRNIAITLAEHFADWVEHVEKSLNYSLEAVGDELKAERKQKEERKQQRAREASTTRSAEAQRELAQQAASTAAPAQKGPGRPKKVEPALAATLGQAAALVPMNGSTANAAARATQATPQG